MRFTASDAASFAQWDINLWVIVMHFCRMRPLLDASVVSAWIRVRFTEVGLRERTSADRIGCRPGWGSHQGGPSCIRLEGATLLVSLNRGHSDEFLWFVPRQGGTGSSVAEVRQGRDTMVLCFSRSPNTNKNQRSPQE